MQFLRARYYDPATGRFISRDSVHGTVTNPITQNAYAYAGDNPNVYADPSGKFLQLLIIGGLALAGYLADPTIESPCAIINPTAEDFARAETLGTDFFLVGMAIPGGGGAKGFSLIIKHPHAVQHLIGGVTEEMIDAAIRSDVAKKGVGAVGELMERIIELDGKQLKYNLFLH